MIAKQIIGSGFRGALEYLRHGSGGRERDRGLVLDTNLPVADHQPRTFAKSFGAFRKLNPKLGRAVYHVSLSPAPGDVIRDEQWPEIANQYLTGMGFEGCGYVLIKHDEESECDAVRPPHVHLLASRIRPDGKTVSDQNNFRRSEKLVREIEARYGLVQLAAPTKKKRPTKETEMDEQMTNYIKKRLEVAATDAEDTMVIAQAPEVFSVAPAFEVSDSDRRNFKREILEAEYQTMIRDAFAAQVRYVRRGKFGLTLHFHGGGRLVDAGDRVTAHGMQARAAAEAIIDLAVLKGWPSVVLTGNETFLREAFAVALARGLRVQPSPEQVQVFLQVQEEYERQQGAASATAAIPAAPPTASSAPIAPPRPKSFDIKSLTGGRKLGERLLNRQQSGNNDIDSSPKPYKP